VTGYSNTGLSAGTLYHYRVRAFNTGNHSAYSNEANAATLPDLPGAPDSLKATTISKSRIDLAWGDNAANEDGFKIERKLGVGGTYAEIAATGPNVTSYSNTGLSTNTKYFYRARAYNAGGHSAFSNEANATTLPNAPKAPGGLTANAMSSTQINLAWADSSNNETGFKIERKTAGGVYAQIATVGANVTNYSNTGLGAETQYFYRVRAYNAGGNSVYSNEANAATHPILPAAPGGLTAVTMSNTQITLAWADSAINEEGFKIERKTGAAGVFAEIATVGPDVTNYSNTGLDALTEYFYRVRAYNSGGHSAFSNEANAVTLPDAPNAPGGLTATAISKSQINLAWADSSNNEDGFKIERKIGAAGTYAEIASLGPNARSYSNTGLSANTQYFYRVRAHNAGGNSAYSNEANAKTLINTPKAPGNLSATTISKSQINLAWADSANNETGFKLERKTGSAGTYAEIAVLGANVTNYSNTGLAANTQYFYRVRAYNAGGNSAYSNAANAKTLPNKPKAPGNLTATAVSSSRINLAWADSANNENGFKIERKTGAGGTYAQIAAVGANVKTFVDSTGLISATQYFYRVRSHNTGGNSAYSNEANATTEATAPLAPSGLSAAAVSGVQINLAWSDNSNNEAGFKIERKTGAAGTYAQIATVGANATSYSNTGLSASTQYFYRVRGHNGGGNSPYSNEANATTLSNSANLALNKPTTALSTDSTSATSRAVDGNGTTYWRSGFVNAGNPISWLRVELHPITSVLIGRAVVKWHQDYFAEQYDFQVSTDGTNWTTVHTNNAGTLGTQDFTFTPAMAKFVRLYLKQNSKSNYRVLELEVYTGSGAPKIASDDVEAASLPETIILEQNYPNPFNPSTQIRYALPQAEHVTLAIFNSIGQEVRRLVHREQPAGFHVATWNGRDKDGNHVPSGVYHYRLQVGDFITTKRMTLTK